MVECARDELAELLPETKITLYRVPGACEIPVCIKKVLSSQKTDVVVALGVIIQGATSHADLVGHSVTSSLQQLALEYTTPVIHEVLLLETEEQAEVRTMGKKLNRGREAARAAVTMVELFDFLNSAEK